MGKNIWAIVGSFRVPFISFSPIVLQWFRFSIKSSAKRDFIWYSWSVWIETNTKKFNSPELNVVSSDTLSSLLRLESLEITLQDSLSGIALASLGHYYIDMTPSTFLPLIWFHFFSPHVCLIFLITSNSIQWFNSVLCFMYRTKRTRKKWISHRRREEYFNDFFHFLLFLSTARKTHSLEFVWWPHGLHSNRSIKIHIKANGREFAARCPSEINFSALMFWRLRVFCFFLLRYVFVLFYVFVLCFSEFYGMRNHKTPNEGNKSLLALTVLQSFSSGFSTSIVETQLKSFTKTHFTNPKSSLFIAFLLTLV